MPTEKKTGEVVAALCGEGFRNVRPSYVDYLLREGYVAPPPRIAKNGRRAWDDGAVDRLRNELTRRGRGPVCLAQGHGSLRNA